MERLTKVRAGVLGINHKLAGVALRSLLAKICEEWFLSGSWPIPCVLLSTCNRTEIYFSSEDFASTHSLLLNKFKETLSFDFDQKLYTYFDKDCFHHLCRVASGLDSAVLAETEIQAQVREAYERSTERHELSRHLHYLFQKSLKVSKEVRQRLPFARGIPSLEGALINIGNQFFGEGFNPKILFVGASAINDKILHSFLKKGYHDISLINRSPAQIERISCLPWTEIGSWSTFDWVIVGTKAKDYILPLKMPYEPSKKILINDLSIPSNVNPKIGLHPQITLMNIDEVNKFLEAQQKQVRHLLCKAETFVEAASLKQTQIFREREKFRLLKLL